MLENIEKFSSSALFFLLCKEVSQLKKYAFNKEISQKLQSFFDTKFSSLDHTKTSMNSIQFSIQENFPEEIRNKILILVELFHRTFSSKKKSVSNQSKKTYQEISQFPQIQEEDDLLEVALVDDYNNLLWCKKVYTSGNKKNLFELKISNIFPKLLN